MVYVCHVTNSRGTRNTDVKAKSRKISLACGGGGGGACEHTSYLEILKILTKYVTK